MTPPFARRLLALLTPFDDRRYALADLDEEFHQRVAHSGRRAAARWYRGQVTRSIVPSLKHRWFRWRTGAWDGFGRDLFRFSPIRDLRRAVRIVGQSPGLAAMAVGTLALGVAAPTTMFSISSGILSELPFEEPDQLVAVRRHLPRDNVRNAGFSGRDYTVLRERQTNFAALAAYEREIMQLNEPDRAAARYGGAAVTPGAFEALGVRPVLGRAFVDTDGRRGSPPVALLSYHVWESRYDLDPAVLGTVVRINGVPSTVVGIMPDGFAFPRLEYVWTPLVIDPNGTGGAFQAFGRLRDGVPLETLQAEIAALAEALAADFPETNTNVALQVLRYRRAALDDDDGSGVVMLYAMLLVLSFVLVIACANVANLLLARALERTREVAVRMALGASRGRVVREVLAETGVVAVLGGAIGIALAYGAVAWFNTRLGAQINVFWLVVQVDFTVLAFAVGLVAAAAVFAGIFPALHASGVDLGAAMNDGSRGATRFRSGRVSRILIASEVTLSCALLILSGLMVKGVVQTAQRSPAFDPDGVFTARADLREFEFPTEEERIRFGMELETRFAAHPAVQDAAITSRVPGRTPASRAVALETTGEDEVVGRAGWFGVTPGFFATFRLSLLEGRTFSERDLAAQAPVVVVTPAFAERFFPDASPLGQRIKIGEDRAAMPWLEVVGVVADGDVFYRRGETWPGVYAPLPGLGDIAIALRTTGDPRTLADPIREVVEMLNANVPVHEPATMHQVLADEVVAEETLGTIFGAFGLVALVMAAVGLYGVVAFGVAQRTKEMGIRRALGAGAGNVIWVVLRGSLIALTVGVGAGLTLAFAIAPALGEVLFGNSPRDPLIYAAIPAILFVSALTASLVPSLRAARSDPMVALRDG